MIKKILPLVIGAALLFTACGSNEANNSANGNNAGNNNSSTEAGTLEGTKTFETKSDKDVIITELTFEEGKPVDVNIDVKLEDGKMKSELSEAGEYVMKEGEENAWHEQIDLLETFIKDNNFDLSKVTLTNDDGNTDAVSGVSIKVGSYVEAVKSALEEASK